MTVDVAVPAQGLVRRWVASVRIPSAAMAAGWWCADPLGVLGHEWVARLGSEGVVVDLDHAHAEAVLGFAGPEVELSRLLAGEQQEGAAHRVVTLHAGLLVNHGSILYVTRRPAELRPAVRNWLISAARAGGSSVLCLVPTQADAPTDWVKGEEAALLRLPSPHVDAGDLQSYLGAAQAAVPLFSVAAFVVGCGRRLDVAELALGDEVGEGVSAQALIDGTAARLIPGGPLDRGLSSVVERLDPASAALAVKMARSAVPVQLAGSDLEGAEVLAELGLAVPTAVGGLPHARPASELMRSALVRHLRGAEPQNASGLAQRLAAELDRANEAMDADGGREPARRLCALLRADESGDAGALGDLAAVAQALVLEHALVEGGARAVQRAVRGVGELSALSRALVVRASLETGELYRTVAGLCREHLGVEPGHRDDVTVLGLMPDTPSREAYRRGLLAGEADDVRAQAVYFGKVLLNAHRAVAHDSLAGSLADAFDRRLYRVSAGQGLLFAFGIGGYRAELERVAVALVEHVRPWHGALAGAHELAQAVDDAARGHSRQLPQRLGAAVAHAQAWGHGTISRAATLVATGTWEAGVAIGEDVQGAQFRGRTPLLGVLNSALRADLPSIVHLAGLEARHRDPRLRAVALWARAALGQEDPVGAAASLADAGEDLLLLWLAEAGLSQSAGVVDAPLRAILRHCGKARAQASVGFDRVTTAVAGSALTPREAEIERARLAGDDVATTAARLGLSERTVETHRAAARSKATELMRFGFAEADAQRWTLELGDHSNNYTV